MESLEFTIPQEIYKAHLKDISGIKFTQREIEVICFLLSGRASKRIALFFSIAPKTVENHTRNIMEKLDCNSRERIIDFIEKSEKFWILKKHYSSLLIHAEFESALKTLASLKEKPSFVSINCQSQGIPLSLIHCLEEHLRLLELNIKIKFHQKLELFLSLKKTESSNSKNLNILSDNHHIPPHLLGSDCLELSQYKNYYFFVFEVIKKILPQQKVEAASHSFQKKFETLDMTLEQKGLSHPFEKHKFSKKERLKSTPIICKKLRWWMAVLFLGIGLGGICLFLLKGKSQDRSLEALQDNIPEPPLQIHSDLALPHEALLLKRDNLLDQIKNKFKGGRHGIQTLALVGIGGVGKTTLARQYTRLQNPSIAWEMNAETQESLKNSFESLASALTTGDEERKILKSLQEIKNQTEKKNKIIRWVQDRIRFHRNWVMIYDNVVDLRCIRQYFPHDTNTWGNGQVIITTRNNQIQNAQNLDGTLAIPELSDEQKLSLFVKIFANDSSLTPQQLEKMGFFLKSIPPYPLDLTIAAHYLKKTNASYKKYLTYLKKHDSDFQDLQKNILGESGMYHQTRYEIIALALKEIIEAHKDFKGLLLFISLLDRQNIPRDLLDACKKDIIVDKFIYHLKKYSLLTNLPSSPTQENSLLSIHPSVQEHILIYLKNNLGLETNKQPLEAISQTLEKCVLDIINHQEFSKIKNLASHCHAFLTHHDLLTDESKGAIEGELGNIYLHLSNYREAEKLLSQSLLHLDKSTHYERIARFSVYLGDVYREIGNYEKAKDLLEKSLAIYKKHFSENSYAIAKGLAHLGAVYRHIGDFTKAKDLLEESIRIYERLPSCEKDVDLAWALVHLGNSYREMGDYKKAAGLLEKGLLIYQGDFSNNHSTIAWNLTQLGNIYREMGHYEKAKKLLEEGLLIYQEHFPGSYDRIAWSLTHLGDVYTYLGDFSKAGSLLEEALSIHEKYFSKNHAGVARTLMCLGNVYRELGDCEKAKKTLEESLLVHKKHFSEEHIRMAPVWMNLGIIKGQLGSHAEAKNLLQKSLAIYQKNPGNHSIESARVLRNLGYIDLLEGDIETSEKLIHEALEMLKREEHPDQYICLELLAELISRKIISSPSHQQQTLKDQKLHYLNQALKVIMVSFVSDSPHKIRIQSRIDQ